MKITLETKSGQKYLLTGEELVESFELFLKKEGYEFGSYVHAIENFLSTYEKEPKEENV